MAASQGQPNTREVELVLEQLEAIPALSPVATRILTLTADDTASPDEIVRLIETDPGLAARLLSMLGRAESGVRRDAINLGNAVRLLGFKAVRHVTLALKVQEAFGLGETDHAQGSPFDRMAFWKHCLAVACAAQGLAEERAFRIDAHEAFLFGLLHDLGKIALHTAMPKSYARVVTQTDELRTDIATIERRLLGVDHMVAGQRLAMRWGLPRRLVDCIWLHHQMPEALPAAIAQAGHVTLVQLADIIAREQHLGWSGNHRVATSSRELAARLKIPAESVARVVEGLAGRIDARSEWIGGERIDARREYLHALLKTTEELSRHHEALRREVVRHRRREGFLNAVSRIVSGVSPIDGLREVCAVAADAISTAFDRRPCLVAGFAPHDWIEAAIVAENAGASRSGPARELVDELRSDSIALAHADESSPLRTATNAINRLLAQFSTVAMPAPPAWIPLTSVGEVVGVAVICGDDAAWAAARVDAPAVTTVIQAASAALAGARDRAAAQALNDELADAGRRAGEAQRAAADRRLIETVTAMAAGAAHELNNPLTVISARAQSLALRIADEDAKKSCDAISAHARAASEIVSELMAFATAPLPNPSAFDLEGCINEVAAELGSAGLLGSAPDCDFPADMPKIRFDRERLRDVLREILKNALDATEPASRRLAIKAAYDSTEEQVVVSLIDNGCGMTPEVLNRAADPFFSHRSAGRSRGLGLARVRRWMLLNGGDMPLESKPDVGTRVVLRLPAASNGS